MLPAPAKPRVKVKTFIKIGRPGYKVTKQKDTKTDQHSLLFQVLEYGVDTRAVLEGGEDGGALAALRGRR